MSVARQLKWNEFVSNPIIHGANQTATNIDTSDMRAKSANRTTDFTFLYESHDRPLRFTNTFKSSVIPGQERDVSTTPLDRKLKMFVNNQAFWQRPSDKGKQLDGEIDRARSSTPIRAEPNFVSKSKSFVDLMNTGEQKMRKIPTFASSVLPLDSNDMNPKVPLTSRKVDINQNKWKMDNKTIIQEKPSKIGRRTKELWKNYMGIKETPFQRYLKEHHPNNYNTTNATNSRKQVDNIPTTVGFNQHSHKKEMYKGMNSTTRKINEQDS